MCKNKTWQLTGFVVVNVRVMKMRFELIKTESCQMMFDLFTTFALMDSHTLLLHSSQIKNAYLQNL